MGGDEKEEAQAESLEVLRVFRPPLRFDWCWLPDLRGLFYLLSLPTTLSVMAAHVLFYEMGQCMIQKNRHWFAGLCTDPVQMANPTAMHPWLIQSFVIVPVHSFGCHGSVSDLPQSPQWSSPWTSPRKTGCTGLPSRSINPMAL